MVGLSGNPDTIYAQESMPSRPIKSSLAELILMRGMFWPYGSTGRPPEREYILHNGLTGKDWSKRKSRSKIARQSKKRNRK